MPEPRRIKAEGTMEDATVTAQTAHLITDIVMAAGIMATTTYMAVSLAAIKAAVAWIKEQLCLEERKRLLSRYMM